MSDEKIQKLKDELNMLNVEDVVRLTDWGENTVRELMQEDDFPTLKIGKNNQVLFDALKEYLKTRRIRRGKNNEDKDC